MSRRVSIWAESAIIDQRPGRNTPPARGLLAFPVSERKKV
jgi:hypothetical protein